MEETRKSEIILELLQELMSEMKSSAGSKFKPVAAEIKTVSAEPLDETEEVKEYHEEPDGDELELEDVLDKAAEDEPKSAASHRLARLAAINKR